MGLYFNEAAFELVKAAGCGNLTLVEHLLNEGADVDAQLYAGVNSMVIAAYVGNLELLELVHERGANLEPRTLDEATPLIIAAQHGHLELVKYLIKNHANINAQNDYGSTAIHLATINKHKDVVKYLIEAGAVLNTFNQDGQSPLMSAHYMGSAEIQQMLFDAENNGPIVKLHTAAQKGDINEAEEIINSGVDVNEVRAIDGASAVVFAVMGGQNDMLLFLIDHGADTEVRVKGMPLLGVAVQYNRIEVAETLINHGADPNMFYNNGSPLAVAIHRKYLEMTEMLIKHGAAFTAEVVSLETAIEESAQSNSSVYMVLVGDTDNCSE